MADALALVGVLQLLLTFPPCQCVLGRIRIQLGRSILCAIYSARSNDIYSYETVIMSALKLLATQVSQYLRGHNGSSFKWKDYSPLVFQRLRQLFGIDNMDYLLSLTGDKALRLLASPGK